MRTESLDDDAAREALQFLYQHAWLIGSDPILSQRLHRLVRQKTFFIRYFDPTRQLTIVEPGLPMLAMMAAVERRTRRVRQARPT